MTEDQRNRIEWSVDIVDGCIVQREPGIIDYRLLEIIEKNICDDGGYEHIDWTSVWKAWNPQ
jgi:hypothetical protein